MLGCKMKHNLASYAYEKDWYFLIGIIDAVKGAKYSEKEWDKKIKPSQREKNRKKFWR